VDPGELFSLAHFKEQALHHIYETLKRGHVPIVVGGTGLYIWSILDNLSLPNIPPHKKLRESLNKKNVEELGILLQQLDAEALNYVDMHNPRRLVRALEVIILSGQPLSGQRKKGKPLFKALQFGIKLPKETLIEHIDTRISEQLRAGLVEEVESLMKQKYGWQLPSMSSLGYREIGAYLRGEMSLEDAIIRLKYDTRQYARRQLTWFKRDERIKWKERVVPEEIKKEVSNFLSKE
jgi:tRNA dimethylallyltransferase